MHYKQLIKKGIESDNEEAKDLANELENMLYGGKITDSVKWESLKKRLRRKLKQLREIKMKYKYEETLAQLKILLNQFDKIKEDTTRKNTIWFEANTKLEAKKVEIVEIKQKLNIEIGENLL